jgi:hypothetical protein
MTLKSAAAQLSPASGPALVQKQCQMFLRLLVEQNFKTSMLSAHTIGVAPAA